MSDDLIEFALGTLSGRRRAAVLDHLETCAHCNAEVESLADVTDKLLWLAPEAEPSLGFETRVIEWRGPSPFFYAPIPAQFVDELRQLAKIVSYGWGVAPVEARIGDVAFKTSLFPKDGGYLLPLKDAVRRATNVTAGDLVFVEMVIRPPDRF